MTGNQISGIFKSCDDLIDRAYNDDNVDDNLDENLDNLDGIY